MIPGEIFPATGALALHSGTLPETITVTNTGDRPVQVGSHFHFFEVNRALLFNRAAAWGRHLCIPAGTAVRFEPGEEKEVGLIHIGGKRQVTGFNGLVNGALDDPALFAIAMEQLAAAGFKNIA